VLTFETRNVRREIGLSDLAVVIAGRVLSSRDIALDDAGNIGISIRSQSAASGEIDIVVIAPELCEPGNENGPGRRLGLPLFSVGFAHDSSGNHQGRPVNDADTKIPSRVVMMGERTRGPAEAIAAARAGPKPDAIRL